MELFKAKANAELPAVPKHFRIMKSHQVPSRRFLTLATGEEDTLFFSVVVRVKLYRLCDDVNILTCKLNDLKQSLMGV